jgi:fructosamine-3-kinase
MLSPTRQPRHARGAGVRATPPGFEARALVAHLAAEHSLDVIDLAFVPKGDVGWSWVATQATGDRVFVKLYDASSDHLDRVRQGLRVLVALRAGSWLDNIPEPLPSLSGALDTTFGEFVVAVQTYLPGESQGGQPLSEPVARQLGRTAARLHASTDDVVAATGLASAADGAVHTSLVDLLAPHLEALLAEVPSAEAKLPALWARIGAVEAQVAAGEPTARVLIHGDMAHDNVLVDDNGRATVVDWDDARLGSVEDELAMTAWLAAPVFPALAEAYGEALSDMGLPVPSIDVAAMELQAWRYIVGSAWFYLERLRDQDLPPAQAESDRNLLTWVVGEWDTTEERFAAAGRALAATSRADASRR